MSNSKPFWLFPLLFAAAVFMFAACGTSEKEDGVQLIPGETTAPTIPPAAEKFQIEGITPGVPIIAYTREATEPAKSEIFVVGVDGSGPVKLVGGEHNSLHSLSPGRSWVAYVSDEEVPNEYSIYVAKADGSDVKKVTDLRENFSPGITWPSEDRLVLFPSSGILLYDLERGQQTTLETDATYASLSLDGQRVAFIKGGSYVVPLPGESLTSQESLELLELESGERRRLDGPVTDRSYDNLLWAPDGRRLGYVIQPRTGVQKRDAQLTYDLYVMDVLSGEKRLVYRVEGSASDSVFFKWSPTGSWLLVYRSSGGWELVLVNVDSGETRQVASMQELPYAAHWVPDRDEESFVYDRGGSLYLESVSGDVRELYIGTDDICQFFFQCSLGVSPDGRYLGFMNYGGQKGASIDVLDISTGEVRTLVQAGENVSLSALWWR
ncbi:MAG: hypothetical protein V3U95_01100 [Dehalococcoidia bacterium]